MVGYDTGTISFIDIETPNEKNDKVCSLGIIAIKDNQILLSKNFLINPDCTFCDNNIKIHGINPAMVIDMPKFPEVWEEVKPFFTNGIVVAHNALFDIPVICKTLSFYGINIPDIYYFCTMQYSKQCNHLSNKLADLCSEYGIELILHHNALHDALACKNLFYKFYDKFNFNIDSHIRQYVFNKDFVPKVSGNLLTKALNELKGMIYGIVCDNVINERELTVFEYWISEYDQSLQTDVPQKLMQVIKNITYDKIVSKEEIEYLNKYISEVQKNPILCQYKDTTCAMQELMGIVEGVIADDVLNELEIRSLMDWQIEHVYLFGNYPFDKIYNAMQAVLQDGIITQEEKDALLELLSNFTRPDIKGECNTFAFEKQTFCLTGNFMNGSKSDVETLIINKCGSIQSSVTKKLKYLVVGGAGSQDWKYGNYGTKVNKALELQESGLNIEILSEEELFKKFV
jgi:DNA polymerase III subunit epsilon